MERLIKLCAFCTNKVVNGGNLSGSCISDKLGIHIGSNR